MKLHVSLLYIFFLFLTFFNILKAQDNKNKVEETHEEQGEMTQEEKDEIYYEFVDYDLNKDGLIDAEEIVVTLKNMKKADFINFFNKVDLDSSGTISIDEYMLFINSN
ncbi:centrin, putative [Plasmodium reichenowi]|uniref:Centrin, putative n=1 Tax=Plasmodium reichenowi TaxID=5854 RepID=A0A060RVA1_PLARE|nr:centrin, putative [Plasmodium reichenowi]KYO00356.1 centrin, putative [Plasmodium reichenowi]CDO63504.1 centrin, putative [Plasmodium reichenowi]SOV77668.1 centrin, putative [Plasmodium reichenowi]